MTNIEHLVTKNTGLLSLGSHDDYHECWVNKYHSSFVIIIMGTEGEQTRSGGYPERDGGEGGEGLGLGYYLVYRL